MGDYLPEELEQISISALQEGEIGFTLPWAVFVQEDGICWIRGDYPLYSHPTDNAVLRIRREGGYIIATKSSVGDHRYDTREMPHEAWEPIQLKWE
jgi:hypothetical protein